MRRKVTVSDVKKIGKIVKKIETVVRRMKKVKTKRGMITQLYDLHLSTIAWGFKLDSKLIHNGDLI